MRASPSFPVWVTYFLIVGIGLPTASVVSAAAFISLSGGWGASFDEFLTATLPFFSIAIYFAAVGCIFFATLAWLIGPGLIALINRFEMGRTAYVLACSSILGGLALVQFLLGPRRYGVYGGDEVSLAYFPFGAAVAGAVCGYLLSAKSQARPAAASPDDQRPAER